MLFSEIDDIRAESWFTWNTNISDTTIEKYQKRANWMVLGYISRIYEINSLDLSNIPTDSQAYWLLNQAEILLASWYLLIKEYWVDWLAEDNQWIDKVNEWKSILDDILNTGVRLFGKDWAELAKIWSSNRTSNSWLRSNLNYVPENSINDDR